MTFKDLKKAADTAVSAKTDTANALAAATEADSHAAADVTATQTAYASAVFGAPGHTVVFAGPPLVIDQSSDGQTVTTITVASGDDDVPAKEPEGGSGPENPPAEGEPASPAA